MAKISNSDLSNLLIGTTDADIIDATYGSTGEVVVPRIPTTKEDSPLSLWIPQHGVLCAAVGVTSITGDDANYPRALRGTWVVRPQISLSRE